MVRYADMKHVYSGIRVVAMSRHSFFFVSVRQDGGQQKDEMGGGAAE